jgi:NAD(P)-dependent dehydrogenase (short-subunit alcohol dehydrogenase family)
MGILDGKAVVVTGGGQGLGRAYALHAAEAGAAVVVNDVDGDLANEVAGLVADAGGTAVARQGSVVDPAEATAVVGLCVRKFGAIDGLVNNAGLFHQASLWDDDLDRIRALVEVNVLGSLYCGIAAAKAMRGRGTGSIVNMASLSMLGKPGAAAYSASKGAVASMTFSWAVDLAAHGIRVNGVCPLAWTRMAEADAQTRLTPSDSPDRIAPLVTYLLSDLSVGVTGQLIRFVGSRLHIVLQSAVKEPVFDRSSWSVLDIASTFSSFSLEAPPAQRWVF